MPSCYVCSADSAAYKCSTCLIRYCCVACYKVHKQQQPCFAPAATAAPVPLLNAKARATADLRVPPAPHPDVAQDERKEDIVAREKLLSLADDPTVCEQLHNVHLRTMLTNVANSSDPEKALSAALAYPVVDEFAYAVMKVIAPETLNDESR